MTQDYVIGVGSNLGDRAGYLVAGASAVQRLPFVRLTALSRVYESEAFGPPAPDYLNAALRVTCERDGEALLRALLEIERAHGRTREVRYGPRTLDLDVLWSSAPQCSPSLCVPHPRLRERGFALAPLLDVAPELRDVYGLDLQAVGGAPAWVGALRSRTDAPQHDARDERAARITYVPRA